MARLALTLYLIGNLGSAYSFNVAANFSISPGLGSTGGTGAHRRSLSDHESLHLHFEAYGLSFDYDLEKSAPAFAPGASIRLASGGGSISPTGKSSFRDTSHRKAALTLSKDDGSVVDGIFALESGRQFHLFFDTKTESMVVVEDKDEQHEGAGCAEPMTPPGKRRRMRERLVAEGGKKKSGHKSHAHSHTVPRKLVVQKWSNCYEEDNELHALDMGIAVDFTYFKQANSDLDSLEAEISAIVDETNFFYEQQLNVRLSVRELYVVDTASVLEDSWNNCDPEPEKQQDPIYGSLNKFKSWVSALPSSRKQGLWHLITDCHPPPGVVGLAYIGVSCMCCGYNSGVTSKTWSSTWKTFAHEIGHNLGASHSFEEGQGSTGGIMDYGDGKLNGEVQFNTKYRKDEVCEELSQAKSCPYFNTVTTQPQTTAAPTGPTMPPTASPTPPPTEVPTSSPTTQNDACLAIPSSKNCKNAKCSKKWCNANQKCEYISSAPAYKRCLLRATGAPTSPTMKPTTATPTTGAPTVAPTEPTPAPTKSKAEICLGVARRFKCKNSRCSRSRWCNQHPLCSWDAKMPPFKKCVVARTVAPTGPTPSPTTGAPTAPTSSPTMSQNQICARLKGKNKNRIWIIRKCLSNPLCVPKRVGRRTICQARPPTSSPTTASPTTQVQKRSQICAAATVYRKRASFAVVNKLTSVGCNKVVFDTWRCTTKLKGKKLHCIYVDTE